MSSHLFQFDEPFYDNLANTNSIMFTTPNESNDPIPFFSDFNPLALTSTSLSDSSIDSLIFQEISNDQNTIRTHQQQENNNNNSISVDEAQSLDQIAKTLLSNSPPSNQLENLSICQKTQLLENLASGGYTEENFASGGYTDYNSSVKTEESSAAAQSQLSFDHSSSGCYNNNNNNNDSGCYLLGGGSSISYDGGDHHHHQQQQQQQQQGMVGFLQRSYSSHSFDGKPGFLFQPRFGSLIEQQQSSSPPVSTATVSSFQQVINNSPDSSSFSNGAGGQMRRVCSTGDLPKVKSRGTTTEGGQQQRLLSSSPLGTAEGGGCYMEEANFKVGRYNAEERKERIDRYRAKRTQRNFNKTIKYACRKTLADNRPRIRGRFARNEEITGEIPIPKACNSITTTTTTTAPISFNHNNNYHHHRYHEDEDALSWVTEMHEEDDGHGGKGRFLSNFGGGMTQFHQYQHYCGY